MKRSAVINLKNLNIKGNIIDIAAKGNTIVSEIATTILMEDEKTSEKDFIAWNKSSIPSEEKIYDYAIAFFSLNTIGNKFKLVKIIKELKRVLKKDGRILIWDAYGLGIRPFVNYELKVLISEGDIRRMNCRINCNPLRAGFNGIIKALKRNGFAIQNSSIMGNIYHIEAVNTNERI